ncbi:MAG: PadR family transcriptional regulator [Candidatus Altiarchaeales archaeon]|nr:PadR family transcriptional regulator [Candidatus Altiarchaeales archaeon]MBD3416952.1 PadR family transcriptional regulator [Candidatus Altiarchaeales archaeon]
MASGKPMNRLRRKTTTECLWPYILSLMKEEPIYAYEIRDMVEKRFGFKVGQVTAYMVLYKLEKEGYVETEWRQVNNRQRKYYKITPPGNRAFKDAKEYLKEASESL